MEIRLAKTAGFCFGVDRAVKLTYGLLDEGRRVATLGPLIHNPQTVEDLERRGALVADTPADVPAGYEVVIRSHGVPRSIYDELDARGCTYHDATCPFVKKIQKVASEAEAAAHSYNRSEQVISTAYAVTSDGESKYIRRRCFIACTQLLKLVVNK